MAALVAASYGAAYWKGRTAGWEARERQAQGEMAEAAKLAAILAGKRAAVTQKVVFRFKERVRVVTQHGEEVQNEITRSVPADAPHLAGYFRRLHDLSCCGDGQVPGATFGAHAAAPVPQADAIRTIAGNYESCHANAEQLTALQRWVAEQAKVAP